MACTRVNQASAELFRHASAEGHMSKQCPLALLLKAHNKTKSLTRSGKHGRHFSTITIYQVLSGDMPSEDMQLLPSMFIQR